MEELLCVQLCVFYWSCRWPSAGANARTNPRWTTRSWAVASVTTTTRTSSTRRRANATSTALSVTCRACWERQRRRSWPAWTFYPQTQSRGSALGYRRQRRRSTAVKHGRRSREPGVLVLLAECEQHILTEYYKVNTASSSPGWTAVSSWGDVVAGRPGANLQMLHFRGKK